MTYGDHLSIVKLMAERDCYRECLDKLRSAVMGRDVTVRGMGDKQLHEVTDEAVDAVRTRLMPEGMEWPKYTDGELVRIGGCWGKDGCDTSITYIERIIFAEDGVYLDNDYNEAFYRHGERVKRPAPKVLDSEGVECNVCTDIDACESDIEILPSQLTHTKPEIDTWQRIEEDKDLNPFDYCKKVGHKLWTFDNAEEFKASDLVRRCKALAGVSE